MDFRFLSIGNLLGIISGLADKMKASELARLIKQNRGAIIGKMPAKVCYPALEGKQWEIITGYDPKNIAAYHLLKEPEKRSIFEFKPEDGEHT